MSGVGRDTHLSGAFTSIPTVPLGMAPTRGDRVLGPQMQRRPMSSPSSMTSRAPAIRASPVGMQNFGLSGIAPSSDPGTISRARVTAQITASTDIDGPGVLNYQQGDMVFIVDGAKTVCKDAAATYDVVNLGTLNMLLRDAAAQESTFSREVRHGIPSHRLALGTQQREFISSPEKFAERVAFFGVQFTDTKTDPSKLSIFRKAGVVLVVTEHEGWAEVANFWGDVSEGSHVGFIVRKFVSPVDLRRDPYHISPLQVVPVVSHTDSGYTSFTSYGTPQVSRTYRDDPRAAPSSRKRRHRTITEMISHASSSSSSFEFREELSLHRPASMILDADALEKRTYTGTSMGVMMKDRVVGSSIDPENVTLEYFDYEKALVKVDLDGHERPGGTTVIYPTISQGHYIPVGVVIKAPRGGPPPPDLIRRAVYDSDGVGLSRLLEHHKITLQVRVL